MELSIKPGDGYLEVHVDGGVTLEQSRGLVSTIVEACQERECASVVIETTGFVLGTDSLDRFRMIQQLMRMWPREIRLAFVAAAGPAMPDYLLETMSSRYGIDLRIFQSTAGAINWAREARGHSS